MKANVHFFSQKESIAKGIDLETLGQRGRQANEFSELGFPILPGFIVDSGVASRLAEEASGLLAASLIGARGLLEADPAGKVESLAQAVELIRNAENAELLAVFRVLAIELVPDARRREFLDAQIQGHLNRIERFAQGLRS